MKKIFFLIFTLTYSWANCGLLDDPKIVDYLLHNYVSLTSFISQPMLPVHQGRVNLTPSELDVLNHIRRRVFLLRSTENPQASGKGTGIIIGRTKEGALVTITAKHVLDKIDDFSQFTNVGIKSEKGFAVLETEQQYYHKGPVVSFLPLIGPKGLDDTPTQNDYAMGLIYSRNSSQEQGFELGGLKLNPDFMNPAWVNALDMNFAPLETGSHVYFVGYPTLLNYTGQRSNETAFAKLGIGKVASTEVGHKLMNAANEYKSKTNQPPLVFDPEKMFYIYGNALPGFSGGGVFDQKGQFLGTLIRAGRTVDPDTQKDINFALVLKAEYVLNEIKSSMGRLPQTLKDQFKDVGIDTVLDLSLEKGQVSLSPRVCNKLF